MPKQEDLVLVLLPEANANTFTIDISPILSQESRITLIVILGIVFGTVLVSGIVVILFCIIMNRKEQNRLIERSSSDPLSPKKTKAPEGSFGTIVATVQLDNTLEETILEKDDDEKMKINESVSSSMSEPKVPYYQQYKNN